MRKHVARLLVNRELSHALRTRWFMIYAGIFLVGGLLLAAFGAGSSSVHGYRGFARAMVGLVHLSLLFVPLMALYPASAAIAEDHENGTLDYLLAQPITYGETYVGKWIGVLVSLVLALGLGFGATGTVAALRGVPTSLIGAMLVYVVLLGAAFVSIGMLLSAAFASRSRATAWGLVGWLLLLALGTLGVMAAFVRWNLPEQLLIVWSFVNPIEAFRVAIVASIDPDLSLLGPVGVRIIDSVGVLGTQAVAAGSLLGWALVPGWVGFRLFVRRYR